MIPPPTVQYVLLPLAATLIYVKAPKQTRRGPRDAAGNSNYADDGRSGSAIGANSRITVSQQLDHESLASSLNLAKEMHLIPALPQTLIKHPTTKQFNIYLVRLVLPSSLGLEDRQPECQTQVRDCNAIGCTKVRCVVKKYVCCGFRMVIFTIC